MPRLPPYLVSLPERTLRSATALASGILREVGEVAIPARVRRSRLYSNIVEATLQFLIEQVGQVEGVYPTEERLSKDFLIRRTAGNGIELIGILAFRASPVWVLAALADASGVGRQLIREIAATLKDEGLLDRDVDFTTVDQLLDGLEGSAGRLAAAINTPPLDVASLREEWAAMQKELARMPRTAFPSMESLQRLWRSIKEEAAAQRRTPFEISSLLAMAASADLPRKAQWLSASARVAAVRTGAIVADMLLEHYRTTLERIRETGYVRYAIRQYRPYLIAALSQFSPKRKTLTERVIAARGR